MENLTNIFKNFRKYWFFAWIFFIGFITESGCDIQSFRSFYFRMPKVRMSSLPIVTFRNVTVETCAEKCVRESAFECKSFDVNNKFSDCRLFNQSHDDAFIHLIPSKYVDHYRTAYDKLFHRLPNHIVTFSHDRKIPGISVEKCARRCILEVTFKCQGFDYEVSLKNCWLTGKNPSDTEGVTIQYGTDYYQRIFDGPFENFINFGYGTLMPLEGIHIYNKIMLGVNLEHCAQLCLAETGFVCASFDYNFNDRSCKMSQLIAANVHGLQNHYSEDSKVMHFEVKDEFLNKFYATPYSAITGHNDKTISRITPSSCARKCLLEREFICRSFDYQIQDGRCLLSSKTGSDVGGLSSHGHVQVHHFELKPFLDCGGIVKADKGDIASPNWPRNYPHNVECTWNITVPRFKIVRISFIHFNIGVAEELPCAAGNDRLTLEENFHGRDNLVCVQSDIDTYISITNSVNLTFHSNSKFDAPGFKLFFQADWACGGTLRENNGEFATPRWPNQYPSLLSCEWIIQAPIGCTIYLSFTSIDLEDQINGKCSIAYDRLDIYNGDNKNSTMLGSHCGKQESKSYTSSENVLYVTFISDDRVQDRGFHAVYKFIYPPTTTQETTTLAETTQPTSDVTTSKAETTTSQAETTTSVPMSTKPLLNSSTEANIKLETTTIFPFNASHLSLFAMFVEPALRQKEAESFEKSQELEITTATENKAVTEIERDVTEKNIRLWHTVIILIILFVIIISVVVVSLIIVCRYYRNRLPKRRNTRNIPFTEESESLYQNENFSHSNNRDKGSSESINLPQPSPSSPPPDVTFTNPMYERRHCPSSSTLTSSPSV